VFGDHVGEVTWFYVDFLLPDGFAVVEAGRMSVWLTEPVAEPQLRMKTVAEMPLAAHATEIATVAQDSWQCREFLDSAISLGSHLNIGLFAAQPVVHPMLRRHQARHTSRPVGRADRIGTEGIGESNPLLSQLVDIGGQNLSIAVTPKSPGTLIVRDDKNNVRGRLDAGGVQVQEPLRDLVERWHPLVQSCLWLVLAKMHVEHAVGNVHFDHVTIAKGGQRPAPWPLIAHDEHVDGFIATVRPC